jgi:hypothetical protein
MVWTSAMTDCGHGGRQIHHPKQIQVPARLDIWEGIGNSADRIWWLSEVEMEGRSWEVTGIRRLQASMEEN